MPQKYNSKIYHGLKWSTLSSPGVGMAGVGTARCPRAGPHHGREVGSWPEPGQAKEAPAEPLGSAAPRLL